MDKKTIQNLDTRGIKLMANINRRGGRQRMNKNRAKNNNRPDFISQGIRSINEGLVTKNNHSIKPYP
jgi:hypothetical protein